LAQMRSADRVRKCLLFGLDWTYRRQVLNDANDPKQISREVRRTLQLVKPLGHTGFEIVRQIDSEGIKLRTAYECVPPLPCANFGALAATSKVSRNDKQCGEWYYPRPTRPERICHASVGTKDWGA
jgi:hypothetical protein